MKMHTKAWATTAILGVRGGREEEGRRRGWGEGGEGEEIGRGWGRGLLDRLLRKLKACAG